MNKNKRTNSKTRAKNHNITKMSPMPKELEDWMIRTFDDYMLKLLKRKTGQKFYGERK
jgi:hypothetical protein